MFLTTIGIFIHYLPSSFRRRKWDFEYILIDAKTKEKSHKNLSSYGFWRRARDSIRATAVAWSLAVTTVHRTVALYRSSFESHLNIYKQKRTDTTRVSVLFSWRRARDSNPRTGYSPLHDFQSCSFDQLGQLSVCLSNNFCYYI